MTQKATGKKFGIDNQAIDRYFAAQNRHERIKRILAYMFVCAAPFFIILILAV